MAEQVTPGEIGYSIGIDVSTLDGEPVRETTRGGGFYDRKKRYTVELHGDDSSDVGWKLGEVRVKRKKVVFSVSLPIAEMEPEERPARFRRTGTSSMTNGEDPWLPLAKRIPVKLGEGIVILETIPGENRVVETSILPRMFNRTQASPRISQPLRAS